MRSAFVQIIAVIGMILMAVLAVRLWNTEAPSLPLSSFRLSLPSPSSTIFTESAPEEGCPTQASTDTLASTSTANIADAAPKWRIPPTPTEYDYPAAALRKGISGEATIACNAQPSGRVGNCIIGTETPTGYGFGASAVQIVKRGCLNPYTPEQGAVAFTVRVPFNME